MKANCFSRPLLMEKKTSEKINKQLALLRLSAKSGPKSYTMRQKNSSERLTVKHSEQHKAQFYPGGIPNYK